MAIIGPLPNTLTNGTTADANQVMADLNFIRNSVNANAADGTLAAYTNVTNTFTQPQAVADAVALGQVPNAKQIEQNSFKYETDTGAVNAYVVTPTIAWVAYVEGADVLVKIGAAHTNTGASTINVSGLGVKAIRDQTGAAIPAGALIAGGVYQLLYDGTNFQIVGAPLNLGAFSATGLLDISPATAGQIKFPATQNPSANVNTLDDYEEGTWTLSVGGTATYGFQTGTYTKIGRLVFIQGFLSITTIGTGSPSTISGLPFPAASLGATAQYAIPIFRSDNLSMPVVEIIGNIDPGGSLITLYGRTVANINSTSGLVVMQDSTIIAFSGSYQAAT